jgi:hypothetical protein
MGKCLYHLHHPLEQVWELTLVKDRASEVGLVRRVAMAGVLGSRRHRRQSLPGSRSMK